MSSNKTRIGEMIDEPKKWYLDYLNNFVTLGGFCDHYGLTRDEGEYIIIEGKKLHEDEDRGMTTYEVLDEIARIMESGDCDENAYDDILKLMNKEYWGKSNE